MSEFKKSVSIDIHDFTERINDQGNKKKEIISPKFKVGETSLTLYVHPQDWRENSQEYIAVYLSNEEKKKVNATYTFKHASGVEKTFKNQKFEVNDSLGTAQFLSHEAYKKWARNHGDVLKVEVEITLHVEMGPAQWTSNR